MVAYRKLLCAYESSLLIACACPNSPYFWPAFTQDDARDLGNRRMQFLRHKAPKDAKRYHMPKQDGNAGVDDASFLERQRDIYEQTYSRQRGKDSPVIHKNEASQPYNPVNKRSQGVDKHSHNTKPPRLVQSRLEQHATRVQASAPPAPCDQ